MKGFTLMEVLVAILVLSIGSSVLGIYGRVFGKLCRKENLAVESFLAMADAMEEVLAGEWNGKSEVDGGKIPCAGEWMAAATEDYRILVQMEPLEDLEDLTWVNVSRIPTGKIPLEEASLKRLAYCTPDTLRRGL